MIWTLKKAWYRIFQFCFYEFSKLMNWREPELLMGAGSIRKLPKMIKGYGLKNVLVITDRGLTELQLPRVLLNGLEEEGISYTVFDDVEENPTIDTIEKARKLYLEEGFQGLVAFGGGSPMDAAKAVGARIARPRKSIEQMGGFLKVRRKLPPLFAVPTTAGTGSETTIAAVVTDSKTKHKYAISDLNLIPLCAVLDPELTVGLPPALTAATAMDAMTHAVESYITIPWGGDKRCPGMAEDAVRLIVANAEKVYRDSSDLQARLNMLLASYYASYAFTRRGLTYGHCIAHTLGGLYRVPHGLANAVILPHLLEHTGSIIHRQLARLAEVAGLDVEGKSQAERAEAFIEEIKRLNRAMGIPEKLDMIKTEDIPRMVAWALKEGNPWYPVPKIFDEKAVTALISRIMT
ncbi:MAG: iron-containing alcohol dehydrogenase [Firmicutes bacterium]|nr:iron-containing alcohol dehydrogenase [Bacillota bacterium]